MIKKKRFISVLAIFMAFMATALLFSGLIRAGELNPPGSPGSTMHTLDEIYDKVEQVSRYPAPVEKTGQTISYATGDDGDLEMGMTWPVPRFTDNEDGMVTDNLTGLMWLKDANCIATNYPGFDTDGTAGACKNPLPSTPGSCHW